MCRLSCIKEGEDVVVLCRGKRLHDGCGWDQEVVLVCLVCLNILYMSHDISHSILMKINAPEEIYSH